MSFWRNLASVAAMLAFTASASAQNYSLAEDPPTGSYHHVQLTMRLKGQLKLQQNGKEITLQESATAVHDYLERLLEAGPEGTAAKSARCYKDAKVSIIIERDRLERVLRPDRTSLVSMRGRDGVLTFCPGGTLSREEMDVVDHFDTLAVTGLLPGTEVKIGDTWKVGNAAVQALCHLQALSENTLTAKLSAVKDNIATIHISGAASGIDQGAAVKSAIQATCHFNVKHRHLDFLDWVQKDERDAGPVSPASALEATIKLIRTAVEPVSELNDVALVKVPDGEPSRSMTDLEFKDAKNRFELQHARDWQLVGRGEQHTVWRLMDRGEFIAQVSVAPWKKAESGQHMTPDEVKAVVANSHGWEQETLIKAEEITLPTGQWCYLVAGEGDLDGVRAVQYFYLVAGPQGDQAILTFTMTPAQVQKLGSRDVDFVRGFLLPGARREGAELKGAGGG